MFVIVSRKSPYWNMGVYIETNFLVTNVKTIWTPKVYISFTARTNKEKPEKIVLDEVKRVLKYLVWGGYFKQI